jgi:hypothetical protein
MREDFLEELACEIIKAEQIHEITCQVETIRYW